MTDHREFRRIEALLRDWFEKEVHLATAGGEVYLAVASTQIIQRTVGGDVRTVVVSTTPDVEIVSLSNLARALADEKAMA